MQQHHANNDSRSLGLHPWLARLRDPQQEAAYLRLPVPGQTHGWPLLALHAGASAAFGAALLPSDYWPLTLAWCLAVACALWQALRAQASGPCREAACNTVLVLGMAGFLLGFSLRDADASWHGMAFCALLLLPYAGITQGLLCAAGQGSAASLAWLCLQDGSQAADAATLLALNLGGVCASHGWQRQRRAHFIQRSVLLEQAMRDHLTGCYNRRYLDERLLDAELARSQRHGLSLTAILCDIDHFKRINDVHGHAAGDAVLRTVAALLGGATRQGIDSVVRHGGEEFLLILPETDLEGGMRLAERLRASLARQTATTASFGVASIDCQAGAPAPDASALVAAADTLLYQAKHAGRNCVRAAMLDTL